MQWKSRIGITCFQGAKAKLALRMRALLGKAVRPKTGKNKLKIPTHIPMKQKIVLVSCKDASSSLDTTNPQVPTCTATFPSLSGPPGEGVFSNSEMKGARYV